MKTFEITLTKSYVIKIKAENIDFAKEFSQIFTSDIKDISTKQDRYLHKFKFEKIDCKLNEIFEVKKVQ